MPSNTRNDGNYLFEKKLRKNFEETHEKEKAHEKYVEP